MLFSACVIGRKFLAGALVALAVAIKAFPLLAILYLVYRRYWTAAISLVIALVILLLLLPIPFRGWHQTLNDVRDWQRGMLHYEQGGIAQRPERGYSWKNQSIFGLANRLLRRVSVDEEPNPPAYANVADLDFRTVNIVIIASALLLGFSFVAAMPRQRCAGRRRRRIRRTFKFDPDFYAARLRLLIRLANVSARAPDQTDASDESASLIWLLIASRF